MKIHILDDWFDTLRHLPSFARLDGHDVTVWTDHTEDTAALAERLAPAEAVVLFRERTPITADLLARLPNLRLISQRSVFPHVDVPACTANHVLLCSNMHAGSPSYAAAELSFGLILAAAREIPAQMASLRQGRWQLAPGQTLRGRRLGLYGYGRIGKQVAEYAQAFGMRVWWWSSEAGRARAQADGAEVAPSRAAFFADSDFISLHVRLKPSTRGIISAEDLGAMRPGASFVNTSRSGLLAPDAVQTALNQGVRLALDVFDQEPMVDVPDWINHRNVIATPHIGYVTEDELDLQFADIYDQINAYSDGAPIHMINPEVWD